MDRRRLKSRSGLHRGLSSGSQSSSKDEEIPLSCSSRQSSMRSSPRISNTELLRQKEKFTANTAEKSANSLKESNIPEKPASNPRSATLRGSKRSSLANSSSSSDEETIIKRPSPLKRKTKEISLKSPSKTQKPVASKKNACPSTLEKERGEKLLSKRKHYDAKRTDSESDEENTGNIGTPLKLRRIEPNIVSERSPSSRITANRSLQLSRTSQLSLKRPSQRESNSSLLKKLGSPVKAHGAKENSISPEKRTLRNKLEDFFSSAGITLSRDNEPHKIDDNPAIIVKKMIELFSTGKFRQDEIVNHWKVYTNNDANLKKALNDMVNTNNEQPAGAPTNFSLVRLILQIPQIQTSVSDNLLQKLNEAVLIANSMDDVPWASLLLQQFRFLEVIAHTDTLTMRLEELLETCPIWFQRELILFIPDIVIDVQHHAIAEILSKLMEAHVDLTNVILECITNLTLGKEYLEELREKVLNVMKNNLAIGRISSMAKFVLYQCPTIQVCEKTLRVLRSLDLQPLVGENNDEYFSNQSLLVRELTMSVLLSKMMSKAARTVIKTTTDPPKPMDLIILLIVHSNKTTKKHAEAILKQHVKTGYYRVSLLPSFYQDYKEVAKDLQPEALQLASNLLKSEDPAYIDFSIEWFRSQFVSQSETIYKQREIIEKIILLMGNNDHTAKRALEILQRMTKNEEEMKYLQSHCNHLRILLEKIDNFDLQDVATLSDSLYALCISNDSSSEALKDDLFILLQKQLNNAKTVTKCKGVLGAAMAIKHLAGKSESCNVAKELFAKVRAGVKNCPRSRALFYDQIGTVIADTKNIDSSFLEEITATFQDEFVNDYMSDLNEYEGELTGKYGLNEPSVEPQKCVINFGDGKDGAVVPAFFRLLRICFMRLNDGNLEDINALLGCPVLVPRDTDTPEACNLDLMGCCINWFRELISAFVTQADPILQEQVLKRLENLMTLQAEYSNLLTMADPRYQPTPCYFHVFPAPPFVRVEKKTSKKGKRGSFDKTNNVPEWEAWEIGSSLCTKNTTYFRHLDPKVVDLLNLKLNRDTTEAPTVITKAQICFLVKELLSMFEGIEPSETLLRDLVFLLPKICSKLQDIIGELREQDDTKNRHAVNLLLTLITKIFDWRGFKSAKYHSLLRDGLRTLAGQIDKANSMLRSSKELVAESYKYFESLADISTDISLAYGVVKICRSLMKHSDTFSQQFKSKQANLASGFLALQWPDDKATGAAYKTAVVGFLTNWTQNEPNPLETVTTVLDWLPDEVSKLEKPQDRLERFPSITRAIFHNMFQKLFDGMIKGVKIALDAAKTDPERIKVWQQVGCNVQKIVQICKSSSRSVLLPFLRSMTSLLRIFLSSGMPIMEHNLRFQMDEVTGIMKMMQNGTRYLNMVCVDCAEKRDMTLAKIVPPAKQLTEKLLYLVKGMLVYNNSSDAFWMGNLVNKNLEGQQIFSQPSSEEPTVTSVDETLGENSDDEARSEILQSDVEEEMSDEDS